MDAVTAAKDLQELGVNYTQEQLDRIKRAEEQRLRQRRMEREAKERERLAALYDPKTDVAKIEFVLSMLDKLIGENGHLQPEDRSLIAASLKNIYKPLIASGYTAPCPTLGDLYRDLNKSNLRRAKQLALMLDVFATGISQDIQDYLDNPVAYALLSNSEFVIMLRQSKSLEALERLYGLSKPQLEFLRNASEGHGIIKMGNSMIPFSNLEPKDTAVYKLITTKPGEATAEK